MSNNKLILRTLNSPWTTPSPDIRKGSVLTHEDVDNNFIYLRGEIIFDVNVGSGSEAGNIVLHKINGDKLLLPFTADTNTFVTGGTYDNNTAIITLNRNDNNSVNIDISNLKTYVDDSINNLTTDDINTGTTNFFVTDGDKGDIIISNSGQTWLIDPTSLIYTTGTTLIGNVIYFDRTDGLGQYNVDLTSIVTGITSQDTYTTGSTLIGNTVYFDRTDSLSAYTLDLSTLDVNDTFVTGGTINYNNEDGTITFTRNDGVTFTVSNVTDKVTTGTTLVGSTLYFDRNDGLSAYTVDLSPLLDDTNFYVTGGTVVGGTLYLDRNDTLSAATIDVSSLLDNTDNFTTGTTLVGSTLYFNRTNGLSAYTANLAPLLDDTNFYTTGSTLIGNTVYFDRTDSLSAYTLDLSSLDVNDTYVTGGTVSIPANNNTNSGTIGLFYSNSVAPHTLPFKDTFTTGGTLNGSTIDFDKNDGSSYSVDLSSLDVNDTFITGMTFNPGNYQVTATRNDGFTTAPIDLSILSADVNVTGGTYDINTGIVTFTNNSGGTFNVSGFTSGMTDTYTTGATLVGNTIQFDSNINGANFYNVDLTPITQILTDGNGITIGTGNTIDLGGTLNQSTVISGNSQTFDLGVTGSELSFLRIKGIQAQEEYKSAGEGLVVLKNPGTFQTELDYEASTGNKSTMQQSPISINSTISSTSGITISQITQQPGIINILTNTDTTSLTSSGLILDQVSDSFRFSDNRTSPRGLEYGADYSTGYTNRSLVDKEYVDSAITAYTPTTFDYIDFNTGYTPTQQIGRIHWDQDYGTLDVDLEGNNINLKVGLDNLYYIKNQSGTTITKGKVVRAAGTLGSSGRILGEYMIADNTIPYYYTLGIAGEDILNGEDGYVYEFGLIRQLNTTGSLYGETWAEGDILYVSSTIPGGLTKVEPIEPNLKIEMAIVVKTGTTNGSIFVRPSLGYNLNDLHNVATSGQTDGDLISYNATGGYWDYTKALTGDYTVNGSLSATTISATTYYGDGSNLTGKLSDVVDDTTPQLGGNLDVNGNKIVSVSNGNIDIEPDGTGNVLLGNFTFDADQTVGAGEDNYVLTYDNATGLISLEAAAGGGGLVSVNDASGVPTYYSSLKDAVNAIGGNGVVTLHSDISVTTASEMATIGANDTLTINGNGYTITHTCNSPDNFHLIDSTNGTSEVYLNNVKIISNGTASGTYVASVFGGVNNGSRLVQLSEDSIITTTNNSIKEFGTIKGGTLICGNGNLGHSCRIENATVTTKGNTGYFVNCNITIPSGGTIIGTYNGFINCYITADASTSVPITLYPQGRFWGNKMTVTTGANNAININSGTPQKWATIDNCEIYHNGTGRGINAVYVPEIHNTYVYAEGNNAIYTQQGFTTTYNEYTLNNVTMITNSTGHSAYSSLNVTARSLHNCRAICLNAANTQPAYSINMGYSSAVLTVTDCEAIVHNNSVANFLTTGSVSGAYIYGLKMGLIGTGLSLSTTLLNTNTPDAFGNVKIG